MDNNRVLLSRNESFRSDASAGPRRVSFISAKKEEDKEKNFECDQLGNSKIYQYDEDSRGYLDEAQRILDQLNSVHCYPLRNKSKSSRQNQFSTLPGSNGTLPATSNSTFSHHSVNEGDRKPWTKTVHDVSETKNGAKSIDIYHFYSPKSKSVWSSDHTYDTYNIGNHRNRKSVTPTTSSNSEAENMAAKVLPNERVSKLADKLKTSTKTKLPSSHQLYSHQYSNKDSTTNANMEPFSYTNGTRIKPSKEVIYAQVVVDSNGQKSKGSPSVNGTDSLSTPYKRTIHTTYNNELLKNQKSDSRVKESLSKKGKPPAKHNVTTVLLNNDDDSEFMSSHHNSKNNNHFSFNHDFDLSRDNSPSLGERQGRYDFMRASSPNLLNVSSAHLVKEAEKRKGAYLSSAKLVNSYSQSNNSFNDDNYDRHFMSPEDEFFAPYDDDEDDHYGPNDRFGVRKNDQFSATKSKSHHDFREEFSSTHGRSEFKKNKSKKIDYFDNYNGDGDEWRDYGDEANYPSYSVRPPPRSKYGRRSSPQKSQEFNSQPYLYKSGDDDYDDQVGKKDMRFSMDDVRTGSYRKEMRVKDFNLDFSKDYDFDENNETYLDDYNSMEKSKKTYFDGRSGDYSYTSQTLPSYYGSKKRDLSKDDLKYYDHESKGSKGNKNLSSQSFAVRGDDKHMNGKGSLQRRKAESTGTINLPPRKSNNSGLFSTLLRKNKQGKNIEKNNETLDKKEKGSDKKKSKGGFFSQFLERNFGTNKSTNEKEKTSETSSLLKKRSDEKSSMPKKNRVVITDSEYDEDFRRPENSYAKYNGNIGGDHKFYSWSSAEDDRLRKRSSHAGSPSAYDPPSDYRQQLSQRYASLGRPIKGYGNEKENDFNSNQYKSIERKAQKHMTPPPKIVITPSNSDADNRFGSKSKLRYFGETDAEDGSSRLRADEMSRHSTMGKTNASKSRSKSPSRKFGSGFHSSINSSESEAGGNSGQYIPNRVASASSTGTGGSMRSVYLHAAAVADIPPGSQLQRRALSKDEISNHSGTQKQSRQLGRSLSVLAPWRPKNSKERYEVLYDNSKKPPKPPRSPYIRSDDDSLKPLTQPASSSDSLARKPRFNVQEKPKKTSGSTVSRSKSIPKDSRFSNWLNKRRKPA